MKLVLFSDLHLDAPFAWLQAAPHVARRRRQALRDTLKNAVTLVEEIRADALLCAGDLYEHESVTPDTAEFLRATFARLHPIPVFLAPGNHDWYGPESVYRHVAWSPNVRVFGSDRLEPVSITEGLTLWGAAHRAPANTDGFLDGFRVDRGGIHLAIFHGSERSWIADQEAGKAPHAPFEAAQIEAAGLHHCFLGHYHRPRDAARHTYPGNPDPLTFGEDGPRGAVVATINADGSVDRDRRPIGVTHVSVLALDVTGCTGSQEVRDRLAEALRSARGVVRVDLHGSIGIEADVRPRDLADVAPWLDALVIRDHGIRPAYDVDAIAHEPTVRGRFVRDVRDAPDLTEEDRFRILLTGLRALAGRDDLDVS